VTRRRIGTLAFILVACTSGQVWADSRVDLWAELGYGMGLPGMAPYLASAGGGYSGDNCFVCGFHLAYFGMFGPPTPPATTADAAVRAQAMPYSRIEVGPNFAAQNSQDKYAGGTATGLSSTVFSLGLSGSTAGGAYSAGGYVGIVTGNSANEFGFGADLTGMFGTDGSTYGRLAAYPTRISIGDVFYLGPQLQLQLYGNSVTPRLQGWLGVRFGSTGLWANAVGAYAYRLKGTTMPDGIATYGWVSPEGISIYGSVSFNIHL
jgi:hypothetical protein